MNFSSDTSAPAHPAILEAMTAAGTGYESSYGADSYTARARTKLAEVFETDLDVYFVSSGTAANALALSILCSPAGAIACHEDAHIERDERGAVEFFTGGGRLSLLPGRHARIDPAALAARLASLQPASVHWTPLEALSLSNLTEYGSVYRPDDIAQLAEMAHASGLCVHMDGARFANALVACATSPAELSWKAGVDVLSFGATKNGAAGCEAILLFGEARRRFEALRIRAKRSGHMPPKARYVAAQMSAYLAGGLWLQLAETANASARSLAMSFSAAGAAIRHPVDGNEVFVDLGEELVGRLQRAGVIFNPSLDGSYRFVCSWATTPQDVAAIGGILARS
jgi:threonine aldolase